MATRVILAASAIKSFVVSTMRVVLVLIAHLCERLLQLFDTGEKLKADVHQAGADLSKVHRAHSHHKDS